MGTRQQGPPAGARPQGTGPSLPLHSQETLPWAGGPQGGPRQSLVWARSPHECRVGGKNKAASLGSSLCVLRPWSSLCVLRPRALSTDSGELRPAPSAEAAVRSCLPCSPLSPQRDKRRHRRRRGSRYLPSTLTTPGQSRNGVHGRGARAQLGVGEEIWKARVELLPEGRPAPAARGGPGTGLPCALCRPTRPPGPLVAGQLSSDHTAFVLPTAGTLPPQPLEDGDHVPFMQQP